MSVLVLGAQGFLGRHVTHQLRQAGEQVKLAPPRAEFDLLTASPAQLDELLEGTHAIVSALGRVAGTPTELQAGNVATLEAIVAACARSGGTPRLVQLGSLAEYGPGTGAPLLESDPARPVTAYGEAKLAATEYLLRSGEAGLIDPVCLRIANPIGAGQSPFNVAGAVLGKVRENPAGPVVVGNLDGVRDFVSAADVGRAVAAALSHPQRSARVINIGTGVLTPVATLVDLVLAECNFDGELVVTEQTGSAASAAVSHPLVADVGLASRAIGFTAKDTVAEAVGDLVRGW